MTGGGSAFDCEELQGVMVLRASRAKLRDLDGDELIALAFDGPCGRKIVLGLEGVDYVSTTVLSALTRVATEHRLRIAHVSGELDHLFGILGVRSFFHRCDSVEDALRDLSVESGPAPE